MGEERFRGTLNLWPGLPGRWFDIAVDDPFGVRGIESIGNLDRQGKIKFGFQGTPADPVPHRHTVQKLHDDERLSALLS